MDRLTKIYKVHSLLVHRRTPISMAELRSELECSRATVARILDDLKNYSQAPIEYDRTRNGYFYNLRNGEGRFELPGLWFNTDELQGLLICQHLLKNIGPGLFKDQIKHLQTRIEAMLERHPEVARLRLDKLKILPQGSRQRKNHQFLKVATALFAGKKLSIDYRARSTNRNSRREISPQNLTYYRDNWYVDAWCHLRDGFRIFAVEQIEHAEILDTQAVVVPEEQLRDYFAASYGIFPGPAEHVAVLVFSAERARWIADEYWHPKQQTRWLDDGRLELRVPFNDHRELLMDILKYGADVEVMAPDFLIGSIVRQIEKMRKTYKKR